MFKAILISILVFYLQKSIHVNAKNNKCDVILDLTFILDSSGSLKPDEFKQAKTFVDRLVKRLNVQAKIHESYIGIISFADVAYTYQFYVPNTQYIDLVSNMIKSLPYIGRSTALTTALEDAKLKVFQEKRGQFTPRIVVLLTDGSGNETPDEIKLAAKQLKEDGQVHLFVVAIGKDVKHEMIEVIASEPVSFYIIDFNNFHSLIESINKLTQISCSSNGFLF